jgi:hypothetical protein
MKLFKNLYTFIHHKYINSLSKLMRTTLPLKNPPKKLSLKRETPTLNTWKSAFKMTLPKKKSKPEKEKS